MNLRKDHYRERQGGGPQGPSSPRPTRDPRAAGAAWEREAPGRVAPGARSPATSPAGPQRNAPAGGGGAGVAARGVIPPAPGTREPSPPAGRAGYRSGPRPPRPGGAEGARKVWKPRDGSPFAGGSRPSARTLMAEGGGPPGSDRGGPPSAQGEKPRRPPCRPYRNEKRKKSKTLSGGSLGSRVDEERS